MKTRIFTIICLSFLCTKGFSQSFPIQGNWKYSLSDSVKYSAPDYHDSKWKEIEGSITLDAKVLKGYGRYTWLRKRVVIPSTLKSELASTGALALFMGRILYGDETYLNGKLVGMTGSGEFTRNYLVNTDDIFWDRENIIAIKVRHYAVNCGILGKPEFIAASPEIIFQIKANENAVKPINQVGKSEILYKLEVANKSVKAVQGLAKAEFFDLNGTKLNTAEKNVELVPGENIIGFPYSSPSSFLKIVYTISIIDYKYTAQWNAEFGYSNVVYHGVNPVIQNKASENYIPARLDMQEVNGWLGTRMKANLEQRLYKVDEKELLKGFINRPGSHEWIGEHVGKFLEAACNAYQNTGDQAIKIQIDRSVQQLIAAQLNDGYLGTYAPEFHWTSWDVWSHKYNLVGLVRYYELSGFKPALAAAGKIGDLMCLKFGYYNGQMDIIKAGEHVGMAATSILDPMTDLYRFTGNKKYLEFCFYIVKSFNNPKGPRIVSTLDSIGRVDKVANTKAYEMLSNIVGLVKLYRITNDEQYLKPALSAWNDVVSNRMYITGTSSSWEHFQNDHKLPAGVDDRMGEGCVTTTWLQFNYQLFSIFGDIKYLDELERTVYNHLTGAENPQTGCVSYYTPLMGVKPYGCLIKCCMSSIPRGIAMIPLFANGKINRNPAFLFYQPGVYKTVIDNTQKTDVEFKTETRFPHNGDVSITVNPSKQAKFKVLLRKPYWAEDLQIKVNGKKLPLNSEEMASIDKLWKKGDKIEVHFRPGLKVLDGGISYPGHIALQRGPQVLAFDQYLNKAEAKNITLVTNSIQMEDAPNAVLPANWVGTQAYQVNAEVNGVEEKIILVPYADAGQSGGAISTWLKKE